VAAELQDSYAQFFLIDEFWKNSQKLVFLWFLGDNMRNEISFFIIKFKKHLDDADVSKYVRGSRT
jgi:hypothetical protein